MVEPAAPGAAAGEAVPEHRDDPQACRLEHPGVVQTWSQRRDLKERGWGGQRGVGVIKSCSFRRACKLAFLAKLGHVRPSLGMLKFFTCDFYVCSS